MSLEEAQMAKIDLALGKLDLRPGMTFGDVGCGWGSVMKRAVERHDVNVTGLTLSKNQRVYCQHLLGDIDSDRSGQVFLRGWEEFDDPVERIVSIEAFEAFPKERYACSSRRSIAEYFGAAGFSVEQTQYLNERYVRTLGTWATNLEAHRDDAVAATSQEVYER
jgi:cyclopropane fatty-acyl-phospholipid synthase-like methyltransferase